MESGENGADLAVLVQVTGSRGKQVGAVLGHIDKGLLGQVETNSNHLGKSQNSLMKSVAPNIHRLRPDILESYMHRRMEPLINLTSKQIYFQLTLYEVKDAINTFRDDRLGVEAGELGSWGLFTNAPEEAPLGISAVELQRSVGLGNLVHAKDEQSSSVSSLSLNANRHNTNQQSANRNIRDR